MITKRMHRLDGRGQGVLIVDGDRSLRLILGGALRNINFEVVLAENGAEGLKAVTSPDEGFDLIVLDLMIPRLDDGYTFIEQVRTLNPGQHPHIIVFTAASRMEVEKIPSNSVCAVVLKPLDLYRVIGIIGNCAKGAHATMRAEFVEGAADAPVRGWGFRKFILVVEDDLKLCGYYRELFEPYGATVEYVSTAAAAREYLPRMDLLIVEVTREGMALLEELRCEHPSLLGRTLIVTSSSLGPQVFGDVPVLEKPFGVAELLDLGALIATYPIERSLGREWKALIPKPSRSETS